MSPASAVSQAAPAPVVDSIYPVPAVCATRAPVVEHVSPAPAVSHAAPAPCGCAAPALAVEYTSPAPAMSFASAAPTVYAAPAPVVEYGNPAPAVSFAAPASVQYAPTVQHAAPAQHPAPTMTVTGVDFRQGWHSRCTPATSGRVCCFATVWSTSPVWRRLSRRQAATAVWHCISGYSGLLEATQAPLVFDDNFHFAAIQIQRSAGGLAGAEAGGSLIAELCRGTVKACRAFHLADTLDDPSALDPERHRKFCFSPGAHVPPGQQGAAS